MLGPGRGGRAADTLAAWHLQLPAPTARSSAARWRPSLRRAACRSYFNYVARNLPTDLVTVSVRQNGPPTLVGQNVRFGYEGSMQVNAPLVQDLLRANACLGLFATRCTVNLEPRQRWMWGFS